MFSELHRAAIISFPFFIFLWVLVGYIVSRMSGWHRLAQRFQTDAKFPGTLSRWFYATMERGVSYNNALRIGADSNGLYLASQILFRVWHPSLFVPWVEVRVEPSRWRDFYLRVTLVLGEKDQVPFRISRRMARKLRSAAGSAWPDLQNLVQL